MRPPLKYLAIALLPLLASIARAIVLARTVAGRVSHFGAPVGSRRALMKSSLLARSARSTADSPSSRPMNESSDVIHSIE